MRICVEHLGKSYSGQRILSNVSFALGEGITCLSAPSGAGKTTLLRILLGLEKADEGRVVLPPELRWAVVFQEDRLLEQLDAMGNLRFVLGASLDETAAKTLLEELGLGDVGNKAVRDYSGGMKRRLALARALLCGADAVALDEPFTGLDEENRLRAWACIKRCTEGKIVLLVSHEALPEETIPVIDL